MNNVEPLPLHSGELYVEPQVRESVDEMPGAVLVFPAQVADPELDSPLRPLFRREVVEQISDSFDTCHFDGDTLVHQNSANSTDVLEILPDASGRYALDAFIDEWCFGAPSTPEVDTALLADTARLQPLPGEVLVLLSWDGNEPHFPAVIDDWHWNGCVIPRFRREVAEVVAAWTNEMSRQYPDGSERAYWAGDDVVLLMPGCGAGAPERIGPDDDGRYCVGGYRWTWELVVGQ
jgi:hypothetical protein